MGFLPPAQAHESPAPARAAAAPSAQRLPGCQELATDPAFGLANAVGVSKLSAKVVAAGAGVARGYCQVDFTYNSGKAGQLFDALVAWVEKGAAPERIIATRFEGLTRPPVPGASPPGAPPPRPLAAPRAIGARPVCPYPKTALYRGEESIDDPGNFVCGGDLETSAVVAQDRLAQRKAENGTGVVPKPYGG